MVNTKSKCQVSLVFIHILTLDTMCQVQVQAHHDYVESQLQNSGGWELSSRLHKGFVGHAKGLFAYSQASVTQTEGLVTPGSCCAASLPSVCHNKTG